MERKPTTAMRWFTQDGNLVIQQWWSDPVGPAPRFEMPTDGEWREIFEGAAERREQEKG